MHIATELARLIDRERVLWGPAAERAYDCDAYVVDRSKPNAVVLPESTEEVARIVRWCSENEIPFTARGAGTGLSGGSLPAMRGVVISTKRLTRILEIDIENRCLLAQAGVVNSKLTNEVKQYGLHFAPDPSSQTVATLGGNIAENAGGPHTLKYGVTVQHILGITMVDPKGEVLHFGGKIPGTPGFDFLGLISGSEGTFGVVTEAWVKLTPLPKAVETVLVAYREIRQATQTVAEVIACGVTPAALEMVDKGILAALKAAFGMEYPEGTQALLLIECDGEPDRVLDEITQVEKICRKNDAISLQRAKDEVERAKLWVARKKGVGALGRLAPTQVTHDGVIPPSKLPEMLDFVYEVAARHEIGVANIFHAGDGNLHPCFYFDDREPGVIDKVVAAGEEIIKRCIELGGSVSGEHGIGTEKVDMMPLMFSAEDLRMQADAKRIFNDGELCNPCKVLPSQKSCSEHKKRWRGAAW